MSTNRLILATTELFAPGGIQHVSRQALAAIADLRFAQIEAWSLMDPSIPSGFVAPPDVRLRLAGGDRRRLGRWAIGAAFGGPNETLVVLMHLHLAPLAFPSLARGAEIAVFLHGVEAWRPLTAAQRFLAQRASLIAISQWTADRFRENNPSLAYRDIDICPLGVQAQGSAAERDEASNVALIVSRLSSEDRYKGHETLIRAWPAVRARVPSAALVAVGDGDDRARLEAIAHEVGVESAVRFVGNVTEAELADWYSRAAFFVLPSSGEGFGLVFLEAMRAGKPCISGPGAPEELVQDDVTGFVVATHDSGRLVDVLARLFEDRNLRERLGANGRRRFLESFTADRFAERLRDVIARRGVARSAP